MVSYRTITERNAYTADVDRQLHSYYVKNIMHTNNHFGFCNNILNCREETGTIGLLLFAVSGTLCFNDELPTTRACVYVYIIMIYYC